MSTGSLRKAVTDAIESVHAGGDNLLDFSFEAKGKIIDVLAEVNEYERTFELDGVTIYPRNSPPDGSVAEEIRELKTELLDILNDLGYEAVRVTAVRVKNSSSASPGKKINLVLKVRGK